MYNSNGVGRIGNRLYISGGESYLRGRLHIDGSLWAYDPATNTMIRQPPRPSSRPTGSPASSTANSTSFQDSAQPTTTRITRTIARASRSDALPLHSHHQLLGQQAAGAALPLGRGRRGDQRQVLRDRRGEHYGPQIEARSTGTIRRRTPGRRSRRCPRLARPVALSFRGSCSWSFRPAPHVGPTPMIPRRTSGPPKPRPDGIMTISSRSPGAASPFSSAVGGVHVEPGLRRIRRRCTHRKTLWWALPTSMLG